MFLRSAALLLCLAAVLGVLLGSDIIPPGKIAQLAEVLFDVAVVVAVICMILEAFPEKHPRRSHY